MDQSASHRLIARLPRLAALSHFIAWIVAALLMIAAYGVWILPAF